MIRLEPLGPEHAEEMFEALRDPGLYAFIEEDPPASVEAVRERCRRLAAGRSPDGRQIWLNWAVREIPGGRFAGTVQATVHANRTAEIAYVFSPVFQGRGLATEACRAAIGLLRTVHGAGDLFATVDPRNARSIRLLERLGFREVPRGQYTRADPDDRDRVFRLGGHP